MKIAICSSFVPFINGGARNIVDWLAEKLQEFGHQVESIYVPFEDAPAERVLQQMLAFSSLDLSFADRVICFRPPAHIISHPNKILWFIHHIRSFYDLWDSPYCGFLKDAQHRGIREALHASDTKGLLGAKKIYTNSAVISGRLKKYNNVNSEVLYPPILKPERFHFRSCSDEIVYICRVEHHKRQHLLVEAMKYTKTQVKLRLCGVATNPDYLSILQSIIIQDNLQQRVIFDNRWISEDEKINYLADCLAAAYLPLDEDSYGYPSLEASHSSKPILTTTDSGGVLELIQNDINGLIVPPEPKALADAMDKLYLNKKQTVIMGENARTHLETLNINWTNVLEKVLS